MATENSIYNVAPWVSGDSYTKDDVVMRITYLDGTPLLQIPMLSPRR